MGITCVEIGQIVADHRAAVAKEHAGNLAIGKTPHQIAGRFS
jgi:hypothetical protein